MADDRLSAQVLNAVYLPVSSYRSNRLVES